jgi:hypothetical protein
MAKGVIEKMRIAVLVFGRLNKCVEHYDNIIEKLGKEHSIECHIKICK